MYSDYFKDWRVGDKYKLKGWIGKGSYGEVAEAEAPNGEKVAVKRIRGLFRDRVDTIRTLREIHILRHLQQHPNIILLKDILIPEDRYSFTEIYVVFEFFDTDFPRGDLDFDELWMDEDLSVNKEGGEWPDWGYYNSTSGDVGQNTPTATKEDAAGSRRRLVENLPSTVNVTRARSYSLVEQAQRAPAISPGDWPFGPPVDSDVYSQVYQDVFGTDAPSASPSNSQQGGGSSKRQRVEAHHPSSTAEDTPAGRGQKVRFSGVRRERAASAPASSLLTMAEGKKAPRQGRMSGIEEATGQGSGSSEEDGDKEEDAVDQLLDIHQHEIPADEGTREAGGQVTEPSSRGADSGDSEEAEGRINSHSSQGSFDSEFQEEDDDIGFEDLEHVQGDVRQYLASLRPVPPKNFRSMFPGAPPEALDLLRSMLRFNPKKRITVNE
ncbi:MPK15, partial [Symbiodinium sp. KB8]